ncbi:unnamed protein product [Penicillium egyptiacum]|uniref:Aminoglycoside phosphotransferase domain-containing protein n=1 Tax=Penicillium egyptiacum TaxID=1303716 RepID=A0A9W4KBZ1_9EURO|nr:unnamed protein product [Penicillium egyptiacum]
MDFVAQHTKIPVPKILGLSKCAAGPYIVMSFVEGSPLSGYLRDPSQETDTLSLEVLLELSKPEFPVIGAVRKDTSGSWTVLKRPFTNRLAQFSNIPLNVFKRQSFNNAADYFEELAQQHFYHLELQRNDAVTDGSDCRKKYIARCLFRRLSHKVAKKHCNGPFRIYCDDLCPDHVLVDASRLVVTGVVDWESAYAAPVEFTYAAPWWLLLVRPEDWESDLDQLLLRFMPRFRTFLEVLRDCEARKINAGSLSSRSQRLSIVMEKSLETGLFWICLASRRSSMFDEIYWKFIGPQFFWPFDGG